MLHYRLGHPNDWFAARPATWHAEEVDGNVLPLTSLSAAQQRWSALAISVALGSGDADDPVVFLCDEPEAGLHRAAEARLPQGLATLARRTNAFVVVASHSPAMLNEPTVSQSHVSRHSSGRTVVKDLPLTVTEAFARQASAHELGLTASDVLQLVRVFVVVEGPHDRAVLEHVLREDLHSASAKTVR